MVKLTLIAQVTDGPPLAELMDEELDLPDADFYKKQAKSLFIYLSKSQNEPTKMSLETVWIVWNTLLFLVFLLFCIFFTDTFIQKIKEPYQDTATQQNIAKLNE